MKIKVSYESNHGKKHYLEFDSVADFIKKYEADPKLGVRFACGVEAQFYDGFNDDKWQHYRGFRGLYTDCLSRIVERKGYEESKRQCLTVGELIEKLSKYDKDTKVCIQDDEINCWTAFGIKDTEENSFSCVDDEVAKMDCILLKPIQLVKGATTIYKRKEEKEYVD